MKLPVCKQHQRYYNINLTQTISEGGIYYGCVYLAPLLLVPMSLSTGSFLIFIFQTFFSIELAHGYILAYKVMFSSDYKSGVISVLQCLGRSLHIKDIFRCPPSLCSLQQSKSPFPLKSYCYYAFLKEQNLIREFTKKNSAKNAYSA